MWTRWSCVCGQSWSAATSNRCIEPVHTHTKSVCECSLSEGQIHRDILLTHHLWAASRRRRRRLVSSDSQPNCEVVLCNIPEIHGRCFLWNVMNLAVHSEVLQEIRNLPVGSVSYDPFPLSQRQEDSRVRGVIRRHQAACWQQEVSCHCTKCVLGNKAFLF